MRSEDQTVTSLNDRIPIFQIGKRIFLTVTRSSSDAPAGLPGEVRSLEIVAGDYVFHLHQMPESAIPATLPNSVQDDLSALPQLLPISTTEWHDFLRSLFGMAVGVLRLAADDKFLSVIVRLLESVNRQLPMQLHQIDGTKAKVAITSRRSSPAADDLLVFFGDTKLVIGRVQFASETLVNSLAREAVVLINCNGNVSSSIAMLLSSRGISRVAIDVKTHANMEEFYRRHERENFDLVSLLAQAIDERGVAGFSFVESPSHPSKFHDRRLNVRFELMRGISLDNGFFASGWFFDPEDQIAEVVVVDHSLQTPRLSVLWKLFHGRIESDTKVDAVQRFVAFLPRRTGHRPPDEVRLRITLKNGSNFLVSPGSIASDLSSKRDALLEGIAGYSFSLEQFTHVFKPAIEPIQRSLNGLQHVREKREFGNRSSRASSIVIPIYREMIFLRSQLLAFALDPYIRDQCEIIYCLDDPLIAQSFMSAVSAYSSAFPLDIKIIILDRNGGYALANNLGVSNAVGENLVLLNSDVIPARQGWLSEGLAVLEKLPPHSVVGPKLLYPDDCIQHAGMYFHRTANKFWQNIHFSKGYGRELPSANIDREVPAVTGACMFIKKSDFLEVDGFCDDYIAGDFEDTDLCLKLRERGGVAFYASTIELYHFERQSMNAGSSRAASTLYNEALHTSKWDSWIPLVNEVAIAYGAERRPVTTSETAEEMSIR